MYASEHSTRIRRRIWSGNLAEQGRARAEKQETPLWYRPGCEQDLRRYVNDRTLGDTRKEGARESVGEETLLDPKVKVAGSSAIATTYTKADMK
jgi:hypothetical protein